MGIISSLIFVVEKKRSELTILIAKYLYNS